MYATDQSVRCSQALAVDEGFRQKPFDWNYEGLKPLLLHEVLTRRRGMSLSLCLLSTCIAKRLGIILTPVPVSLTGRPLGQSRLLLLACVTLAAGQCMTDIVHNAAPVLLWSIRLKPLPHGSCVQGC